MKALVIGATGATGRPLVEELLKNNDYSKVVIFVRRSIGIQSDKLIEYIVDFSLVTGFADRIVGDVLFCCMGTTLKAAGSKDAQWRIDYEIPLLFAEEAKTNGVKCCVLVSSANANSKSRFFYSRMKGELEERIAAINFQQYIIFRPGMLKRPNSDRGLERLSVSVLQFFNRLGLLKKQRPLPTPLLAQKISVAPLKLGSGVSKINLNEIFSF